MAEQSASQIGQQHFHINPPPIPHLRSPTADNQDRVADGSKHDVIIVGTGMAGMMLSYLLAYYGLAPSVLPLDKATTALLPAYADGIQPRTLEVLKSLGLVDEILSRGASMHRMAFWNPGKANRIERSAMVDDVTVATRYKHKVLLAGSLILNIIERGMNKYGGIVERGTLFEKFELLSAPEDVEFPVRVTVKTPTGEQRHLFTRYLVGADGAHSKVRECMDVKLQGESKDDIWGVVDAVVKTNFPDFRKRCSIRSPDGGVMSVPREIAQGHGHLNRMYIQLESGVAASTSSSDSDERIRAKEKRANITLDRILDQIKTVMAPYSVEVLYVDWWSAYHVGQRVAERYALKDKSGIERVFIMGDATHTHTPKAGQGMNVSMMDAFNLGWKLAQVLKGHAPAKILSTYEIERLDVAQQLIAFDKAWSANLSQVVNQESKEAIHEELYRMFSANGGFTSGCGVQYVPDLAITPPDASERTRQSVIDGLNPDSGALTTGRRLINISIKRYTDDAPVELHDVLPSKEVKYTILCLIPRLFKSEFLQNSIKSLLKIPCRYAAVAPLVLHPLNNDEIEWTDFPLELKDLWEWNLYGVGHSANAYEILGVREDKGLVAVVRPDGVVGGFWAWEDASCRVREYVDRVLVAT